MHGKLKPFKTPIWRSNMKFTFYKALLFYAKNEQIMSCLTGQIYCQKSGNIGKVTLDEIEGEWELVEEGEESERMRDMFV